jgi:hypothetical protein
MAQIERIDQLMLGAPLAEVAVKDPNDTRRKLRARSVSIGVGARSLWLVYYPSDFRTADTSITDTSFEVTVRDQLTENLDKDGLVVSRERSLVTHLPTKPSAPSIPLYDGEDAKVIFAQEDIDGPINSRRELQANFTLTVDGDLHNPDSGLGDRAYAAILRARQLAGFNAFMGRLMLFQEFAHNPIQSTTGY